MLSIHDNDDINGTYIMRNSYKKSYKKTYRKMRRVQKGIEAGKKGFSKVTLIFILCAVCAGIVAAGIIGNAVTRSRREKNEVKTDSTVAMVGETGLPYIEMLFEDGSVYDRLTGYQSDTFSKEARGYSLAILPGDLRQRILISEAFDNVKSLSYQVRDISTGDLIEETSVDEVYETGGLTEAVLNIKNLINVRHEYNLQIKMEREKDPTLIYNTRIETIEEPERVRSAIELADSFIHHSVSDEDTDFIDGLIDAQSTTESFNYALTDNSCPASLIMWKGLSPRSEERAIASLLNIDGEEALITASYAINVLGKGQSNERIVVNDLFRVSLKEADELETGNPLIDFKRKAYETVSGENMRITDTSIPFGFQADESMQSVSSETGQYVCFVNGGNLWRVCSGTGVDKTGFVRLFSFEGGGEGQIRTDLTPVIKTDADGNIKSCESGFGINIITVRDNGDVTFAVYGAFPGGVHAGESGIGVYEFSSREGALSEVLFVRTSKDMEAMREFAAESYLNEYGEMYVTVDGADNKINVNDYSFETVTGTSADNNIFYSDDASVMAYSARNAVVPGMSDRIEIFDRDEAVLRGISAEEGRDLKIIGFIGDDVVYGIAGEDDYESAVSGVRSFYSKLVIADKEGNEIKSRQVEGELYTDVRIAGGTLEFVTAKREGDGFVTGESAGIVANNTYEDQPFILYYKSSDERRKEMFGSFTRGANDGDDVQIVTQYEYNRGNTVDM